MRDIDKKFQYYRISYQSNNKIYKKQIKTYYSNNNNNKGIRVQLIIIVRIRIRNYWFVRII